MGRNLSWLVAILALVGLVMALRHHPPAAPSLAPSPSPIWDQKINDAKTNLPQPTSIHMSSSQGTLQIGIAQAKRCIVNVNGEFNAVLLVEVSDDGTTWQPGVVSRVTEYIPAEHRDEPAPSVAPRLSTITEPGQYEFLNSGHQALRLRLGSQQSGSLTVEMITDAGSRLSMSFSMNSR